MKIHKDNWQYWVMWTSFAWAIFWELFLWGGWIAYTPLGITLLVFLFRPPPEVKDHWTRNRYRH